MYICFFVYIFGISCFASSFSWLALSSCAGLQLCRWSGTQWRSGVLTNEIAAPTDWWKPTKQSHLSCFQANRDDNLSLGWAALVSQGTNQNADVGLDQRDGFWNKSSTFGRQLICLTKNNHRVILARLRIDEARRRARRRSLQGAAFAFPRSGWELSVLINTSHVIDSCFRGSSCVCVSGGSDERDERTESILS